jgi:hypothetical protein
MVSLAASFPREITWFTTRFRLKLDQNSNERQWTILPAAIGTSLKHVCQPDRSSRPEVNGSSVPWRTCPHELWITLDLMQGGWDVYNKFTVRLSWPASASLVYLFLDRNFLTYFILMAVPFRLLYRYLRPRGPRSPFHWSASTVVNNQGSPKIRPYSDCRYWHPHSYT